MDYRVVDVREFPKRRVAGFALVATLAGAGLLACKSGPRGPASSERAEEHVAASPVAASTERMERMNSDKQDQAVKSDKEWKEILTPEQYHVLREKGTERAFTGRYWNSKEAGTYVCAACGQALFRSKAKFDSGTGWPSYCQPISEESIRTAEDRSLFLRRTEVLCSRCGGHLGHVFEDGPPPSGLRYCINSASLKLVSEEN